MPRAILCHLCSWALAGAAWAGDPAASLEGQTRVELDVWTANRYSSQKGLGTILTYKGDLTPGYARLTGTHFFHPVLGVTADLGLDLFGVTGPGFLDDVTLTLAAPQFAAGALGRVRILEALSVEGQIGYGHSVLPTLSVGHMPGEDVKADSAQLGGPQVGAQVRWDAWGPLTAQAGARWIPFGVYTALPDGAGRIQRAFQIQGGAGVTYRLLGFGPARFALGASYELAWAEMHGTDNDSRPYNLDQVSHRFGLTVHGWLTPAGGDMKGLDRAPPSGPGRIHGLVVRDGSAPVPGAKVEVPGKDPVLTRQDGSFAVEQVPPGPVEMMVTAAGFKARSESVTVTPGGELKLTVTLQAPTGPGRIKGTAFAAASQPGGARAPLADVAVAGPNGSVRAAADGTFTLDDVGPGPVQVKAALKGYKPVEEVVSVPPEGEAALELTLVREAARVLASMRGQVRTVKGKPVSAFIKVPEAQISTRTGADGRFSVRLPGGKYTVVFEAPGYVRQTKTVEVADGDQAIFYVDLSREDR